VIPNLFIGLTVILATSIASAVADRSGNFTLTLPSAKLSNGPMTITLSAEQAHGDGVLAIGAIDVLNLIFVNGHPVGYTMRSTGKAGRPSGWWRMRGQTAVR
jgi:hypothetical protein